MNQPIGNGLACPNVTGQSKPCDYVPCAAWSAENWLSCAPYFGSCGLGIQHRNISCRDEQNNLANRKLCQSSVGEIEDYLATSERERLCRVPCKGQTSILPWSAWGLCQPISCLNKEQVRSGNQYRHRAEYIPYKQFVESRIQQKECVTWSCFSYQSNSTGCYS